MRMLLRNCLVLVLANASLLLAQTLSPGVQPFVKENAPVIALSHVRVIDGQSLGNANAASVPSGTRIWT